MGVATKNRRRIVVRGLDYLWYVAEDIEDFPHSITGDLNALNILSEDKRFIARYHLGQADDQRRHITIIGREFRGIDEPGCWRRFLCPDWYKNSAVTPSVVRAIIEWCSDPSSKTAVDYSGKPIEP